MFHFERPCDVIIIAGQSNAEGFGLGDCEKPYEKDERVLFLDTTKMPAYELVEGKTDVWYLEMKDCEESRIGVAEIKDRGCFAHYFAREYIKNGYLKDGRKLLLVFAPVGGTGFGDTYWGVGKSERVSGLWTTDGPLYKRMIGLIDDALKINPENKIVGLLWHQGENNVNTCKDFASLGERSYQWLSELLFAVKERYRLQDLPIVCGEFVRDTWYASTKEGSDIVMDAMARLMKDLGGGFARSEGLLSNNQKVGNGDGIHFCHDALRVLGERYFAEFTKIEKR